MAWISRHHKKTSYGKRFLLSVLSLVIGGGSLLFALPAAQGYALNQPATATINKTDGAVLFNTDQLSGTVTDLDGVASVSVRLRKVSNNVAISPSLPAVLGTDGSWSVQLTKNTAPIDLADGQVRVVVTVIDQLSDQTSFSFGPFHLAVPDADVFQSVVETLAQLDPASCPVAAALQSHTTITVFGPNNEALAALPSAELQSLLSAPDELCAVVANHIINGAVPSDAVTGTADVPSLDPNTQPLTIQPQDGSVAVNQSVVVNADNPVTNAGFLHVVNALIHPVSQAVNINDVYTSVASPALSGSVADPTASVSVRVNGVSYSATNNGDGTWSLPAGTIHLDLKKTDTLFSVVARKLVSTEPGIFQDLLLGLTLRSDDVHVVSVPIVINSSSTTAAVQPAAVSQAVLCGYTCETGQTSSTSVSVEAAQTPSPAKPTPLPAKTNKKTNTNQWYWWLIGIATVGALYYVLGGSSTPGQE